MRHHHPATLLLAVSLLAASPGHAAEQETLSDIWAEARIVMDYTLDRVINPFDLEVEVRDRTAYLTGTLPSASAREHAEQLALAVDGVDRVENGILLDEKVPHNRARYDDPAQATSDRNMAAMVKAQLRWNKLTHAADVSVDVRDGVVTLSGPVRSEEEAREMVRIATSTRLVEKVHDRLEVQPD